MTTNKRRHMLSGKKINEIKYDYGKKNTIYVESPPEEEVKLPKAGDILFYKKRGVKEKRLNQINQWKFICVETEGKNKGKWKVQGLHRKEGDFCWFEPNMLRNSKEILTDPVKPSNQPMRKEPSEKMTKVKVNKRRELIKSMLSNGNSQKQIANTIGISEASVSQHVKIIRLNEKLSIDQPNQKDKEEEMPIFSLSESAQYLRVGKTRLWDILKDHNIKPIINGKRKELTESQIERIAKIIEAQNLGYHFVKREPVEQKEPVRKKEPLYNKIFKEDKEEDLATYGIDFPVPTTVVVDEEKTEWEKVSEEKKPRLPVHVASKRLGISETAIKEYIGSLSIKTKPLMSPYIESNEFWESISDEDVRRIKQAIEIDNAPVQREHKATIEMKNYNYKRVISENLRLIKSLVHQTNELLEKIQ